jgi:urease accessory protein
MPALDVPAPCARSAEPQLGALAFLRSLQFASPTLPIGAFAYSQGLEQAVASELVRDEASASSWISGLACELLSRVDLPVFAALYRAWSRGDRSGARALGEFLQACRESSELLEEDRNVGGALARVLDALEVPEARAFSGDPAATLATLMSLAAVHFELPLESAALAYLFSWSENQVAAACRLVPLGHIAGQRVLSRVLVRLPDAVARGLALPLDGAGLSAQGFAIASALHETAYCRLFRS